jgi:hypothetical protein
MYITPDVFTTEPIPLDTHMPSESVHITYDFQPSVLGKRRRAGCDKATDLSPYAYSSNADAEGRLTGRRRSKLQLTFKERENSLSRFSSGSLPSPPPDSEFGYELERTTPDLNQRTAPSKHRRRVVPLKKQRLSATDILQTKPGISLNAAPILTPCHVCYKAPRLKRELDAYEDCWRCHERTCFICMRQCQAGCNERKICRQCSVEQGEDGDVSCLDCLERSQDQEMEG